ncbi:hypothetical protein X474_17965 [Dethiosulfatarculus sandiegensis]|uniref:Uncharacterized protein n=1 Tax=Dethiosulfatarculus sandiegensis TaxID=1429043 RepID=A0A0D2JT56_9BACT|nr:hypothetical protein X474_17965 [Dethiosulfatarculus sandiegensis]
MGGLKYAAAGDAPAMGCTPRPSFFPRRGLGRHKMGSPTLRGSRKVTVARFMARVPDIMPNTRSRL